MIRTQALICSLLFAAFGIACERRQGAPPPQRGEYAPAHAPVRFTFERLIDVHLAAGGTCIAATVESASSGPVEGNPNILITRLRLTGIENLCGGLPDFDWTRPLEIYESTSEPWGSPYVTTGALRDVSGQRVVVFVWPQFGEETIDNTRIVTFGSPILFNRVDGQVFIGSGQGQAGELTILDNIKLTFEDFVSVVREYSSGAAQPECSSCDKGSYCWMRQRCMPGEQPVGDSDLQPSTPH